tara:strand:+ start:448 stop:1152 length:705 start_codon:yes stop_codon:yes gene_type:complete
MKNTIQNKTILVNSVFSTVYKKYDLMNDIMSFGIHRIWKNKLLDWMNPQFHNNLIDVASGTGDIAKLYSNKINGSSMISCVEPNNEMFEAGKKNLQDYKNISWHKSKAERLPFKSNTFDFYTISYGIRNVTNIDLVMQEAFRVLKPGGRFMCLEFSKVDNEMINFLYQQYSKVIPFIGQYISGSFKSYHYLVKSINSFYSQKELVNIIKKNGFSNVEYRNLSNGISAIHSGWKI